MPTINNILSRQYVLCISVPRGRTPWPPNNRDVDVLVYSIITDNARCIIIHDNTFHRNF